MNAPVNKKKIGVTILFLLCAISYVTAQTATPTALVVDYDQTQVPTGLEPGDEETIYFVVKNTGGLPAREVLVSVFTSDDLIVKSSSNVRSDVESGGSWVLGTINPGTSSRFAGRIRVGKNAPVSTHYLTLNVQYDESRYNERLALVTEEVTSKWLIPVEVTAGSLLELDDFFSDRTELRPGDNVLFRVTFENTGESDATEIEAYLGMPLDGSVTNTAANVELYQEFNVLGTTKKRIDDIKAGQKGVVEGVFHIDEDITPKAYTIPLTVEYQDNSRTEHTNTFYVGLYITGDRKLAITNFQSDPAEIHSDDTDVEFSGNVENQGTEAVKNVKVTFVPDYPFKNARSFVQTKEAGTIAGGASTAFTFYADVEEDIEPQATNVSFLLDYEVNSQPFHDTVSYVVDILENPKFGLGIETEATAPGGTGSAKVTVSNSGALCDSVTLIVLEKSDQPFSFDEKSAYIGDLDRGESGVATITFDVDDNVPAQPHLVPVQVRCTKDNDVLIYDKTVKLEVGEAAAGGSYGSLIFALVLVIVIGLYLRCRSSKEKKVLVVGDKKK
ncbi:MAG: hypothetical protein ABH950_06465 [Candidatus Altiarchaeota archaeon]